MMMEQYNKNIKVNRAAEHHITIKLPVLLQEVDINFVFRFSGKTPAMAKTAKRNLRIF